MNWKKKLFKPRWQHKDAAVRAEAVSRGQESELLQALDSIAAADEAPAVRAAAARRLSAPKRVAQLIESEPEPEVRTVLQSRLRTLLMAPEAEGADLESRIEALKLSEERSLLEAVAAGAPAHQLRRVALERIDRVGFLGDRAIDDPDPELRRYAASRITQDSTLKRVIEATRTTDKQLHQELLQRLHEQRLAAGDASAVRQEAQTICEALEALLLQSADRPEAAVVALEQRWHALGGAAPGAFRARFEADLARYRAPRVTAPAEAPAPPPAPPAPIEPRVEPEAAPKPMVPADTEPPAASASPGDEEKSGDQADHSKKKAARAAAAAAMAQKLEKAEAQLQAMKRALEDGELHRALKSRARLQTIGSELKGRREWKTMQSQLNAALGRLRELRDWQHWANDKIRKRLIDEMEAIPGAALHPDAVLAKIKSLQAEWKQLETSEQIPGDRHYAAAPWMWRRFNAAGKQAFELTKPFLDKRSEIQSNTAAEFRAVAQKLTELCERDTTDWKALNQSMSDARTALRSLVSVPAAERKALAEQIKGALERAKSLKQTHYDTIEKEKLKLIREADQLAHAEDRDEAIGRAKALQAQWKAAGRLWRSRENELWQKFRAPIDPLFAALDEAREEERAEQAERKARQQALCEQLEGLLEAEDEALQAQHGKVQGLSDEWHAIRRPDRRLQSRFETALEAFQSRQAGWQRAEAQRERERWWAKADLLQEISARQVRGEFSTKQADEARQQWAKAGAGNHEIDRALEARFEQALASDDAAVGAGEDAIESARSICIALEFLAGLPSPDDEKDNRMQYQVERLSAAMTGERPRRPALEEARELEQAWLLHAALPPSEYTAFRERVRAAIRDILQE